MIWVARRAIGADRKFSADKVALPRFARKDGKLRQAGVAVRNTGGAVRCPPV
jgi:hypothetical protein